MAHKIDEIDLTPPEIDDDFFPTWLIENFARVRQTLIDGFTGDIIMGEYTHSYEFGVLSPPVLTEVFSDEFGAEFR